MLRRLIRISPPYYFGILISLILLYVKIHTVDPTVEFPTINTIYGHLLYVQGFFQLKPINIVYWTLCYEIQFYLVFSLVIYVACRFQKESFKYSMILIIASLTGISWLGISGQFPALQIYIRDHLVFIYYWYAFSAGALVGWLMNQSHPVFFRNYTILFYTVLLVIGVLKHDLFAITSGLTAAVLHLALYKNKINSWLNFKPIQTLGLISYSLYLIHNNLLGIVARITRKFLAPGILADIAVASAATVACLIAAFLMYELIERPVIKLSQRIKY